MATRRMSACHGGGGYGQPEPAMNMNYHRTHSEHVTKVAGSPYHAGAGAVQHHVVHKESFKEVDDGDYPRRGHNNHHALQQQQQRHHGYGNNGRHGGGGGGSHRFETYEETYEETCEEETYSAGRHHGHGHGGAGRRYEYETYEETSYEEEEEVVGGGGCAQLKRGYRCA